MGRRSLLLNQTKHASGFTSTLECFYSPFNTLPNVQSLHRPDDAVLNNMQKDLMKLDWSAFVIFTVE